MDAVPPLPVEYFLLAHDDYTGRPHISLDVLSTGLSGAVLAELLVCRRIGIVEDDRVRLIDPRPWDDDVTDLVVAEISKQRAYHPIRAWVEYLRGEAYSLVGEHLVRRGVLSKESGWVRRKSVRYVPADSIESARPRVRLRYLAQRPDEPLDEPTAALAALAQVTKLEHVVGEASSREVREGLEAMSRRLHPDMQAVVAGVDKAVTAIALSIRGR